MGWDGMGWDGWGKEARQQRWRAHDKAGWGDSARMGRLGMYAESWTKGSGAGRTGRPEGRERGEEGLLRCGEDDVFMVGFEAFDGVLEDGA